MGKYVLQIAFLFALITNCLTLQTQQKTPPIGPPGDPQTPQIIVASQPDSPLLVTTLTRWATPDREMLEVYVAVKNQDAKSVRSYTTRIDFDQRNGQKEPCLIENIYSPDRVIKLENEDGKSRFLRVGKNSPTSAIHVSVDYVEFADGSTWGQDTCQTVEYLAGERAGGDAAIKWFQNFIKVRGTEAAVEAIRSGVVGVEKPYNQSAKWHEAFGRGVEIISQRVIMAYQNKGETEVGVVLGKPYDASGSRQ